MNTVIEQIITLKSEFNMQPTFMLGDAIMNGCTTFNIKDIDEVCLNNDVPDHIKLEAILAHSQQPIYTDEEYNEMWDKACQNKCHYSNSKILIIYNKKCLDKAIKSSNFHVRMTVAKMGYKLDQLVNDESCLVRCAVAQMGYGLDTLVNDEIEYVRIIANEILTNSKL